MRRPEFVAKQGRCPRGILGRLIGRLMAVETKEENRRAVELLSLRPGERVLEVGFGHGRTLAEIARLLENGFIAGADTSPEMVRMAAAFNAAAIREGRMALECASTSKLPYNDGSFDAVLAVHTLYFWHDLPPNLVELRRVLRPGGRLLLVFRPRDARVLAEFPASEYHFRTAAEVEASLTHVGFHSVRALDAPGLPRPMCYLQSSR